MDGQLCLAGAGMKKLSELEETLALYMRVAGLPDAEREYQFHPPRKWRFDFAYCVNKKIAIECEGLTAPWMKSRHTTNQGFTKDCEKYNQAALDGWCVLRFTMPQIKSGLAVQQITEALNNT
jgi:very-short-patch-repair endonuclease